MTPARFICAVSLLQLIACSTDSAPASPDAGAGGGTSQGNGGSHAGGSSAAGGAKEAGGTKAAGGAASGGKSNGGTSNGGASGSGNAGAGGHSSTGGHSGGGGAQSMGGHAGTGGEGPDAAGLDSGPPINASPECKTYCACMATNCSDKVFPEGCLQACTAGTKWDLPCRQNMCGLVPAQPNNDHCTHAFGVNECLDKP